MNRSRFVLAMWPVIAVLMVYLIVVGSSFVALYSPLVRLMSIVLASGAITAWILAGWLSRAWSVRSRFTPVLLLAVGVFVVCSLASRSQRIGLENSAWAALLAALYLVLERLLADDALRARILTFVVVAALTIGVGYIVEVGRLWIEWWTLVGRVTSPPLRPASEALMFGNPSVVMVVETMFAGTAVGWIGVGTRRRRLVVGAIIAVAAIVALMTGSRSGWLAAGVALSLVGLLFLVRSGGRARRALARVPRVGIAVAAGASVLGLVVIAPGVLYRVGSGGEDLRIGYLVASLRMFVSSPVVGVGPGMWPVDRIAATAAAESDYYIPYAHNIYVQGLAEFGLLAIIVALTACVVIFRVVRLAIQSDEPIRQRLAWAALFVVVYFGVHQLLDSFVAVPAALLGFAVPVAALEATDRRPEGGYPAWLAAHDRLVTAAVSVVFAISVGGLLSIENRALVANDALVALNSGDMAAAVANASLATSEDPGMAPYELTLGIARAWKGDLAGAQESLRSAAEFDDLPNTWVALAAVQLGLGDLNSASTSLDHGERLGVQQPLVALDAGWLRLKMGDRDRAIADLAESIVHAPNLAEASAWRSDSTLATVWPEVLTLALQRIEPAYRWGVALSAGDIDRARLFARDLPPAESYDAAMVVDAWASGSGSNAYATLIDEAEARPMDEGLVVWATRTAKHLEDAVNGDRLRRWVIVMSGGFSPSAGRMEIVIEAPDIKATSVLAGSNATFYGHYTYRRPTPSDLTVPGLPTIQLR